MFIRIFSLRFLDQIAAIVHHGLILFEVPPADLCHEIKIHFWMKNWCWSVDQRTNG